jgi:cytochrome c biogenesis protein CcmG, thiol:disulfide interchange protein DsbE
MTNPPPSQPETPARPAAPARSPVRRRRRRSRFFFWPLAVLGLLAATFVIWQLRENRQVAAAEAVLAPPELSSLQGGTLAPDFTLPNLQGDTVRLSDLRDKVVLLNFWASWCLPCQAELPDLSSLYQEYGADHNFVVLTINMEEQPDAVRAFAQRFHVTAPLLLDEDGRLSANTYEIRSLPTTIVIDRAGRVRDQWVGQLFKSTILARLRKIW